MIGFGVGVGLNALGAIFLAAGAPALLVTGGVLLAGVASSMFIDWGIGNVKDWWYRRGN